MRLIARIAPHTILAFALAVATASAQEITPANLPADTSFVIFAHSSAQIRAGAGANPFVETWYSPESAQVRRLFVRYLVSQMDPKTNGQKFTLSPENLDRLLSVMENSLVFGISGSTDYLSMVQAPAGPSPKFMKTAGMYFILDISGKEAQFTQLWPALTAELPKEITHRTYSLGGVSVEKFTGPNQATFSAQVGNRFIWSNQQAVIEQLIARLTPGQAPGDSLAGNSDYQHCQSHVVSGAVFDAFFRVPDLSKLRIPATPQFDTSASVKALHLESIHAVCGNMSMTPEGELAQWTILGDTSQGALLSWFGANRAQFDTLGLVPPSAASVMFWSYDLPAVYKSVKTSLSAGIPGGQQGAADLAEGMAAMQLGMPITDALGLFRGELAAITMGSQSPTPPSVIVLTISNPQRIMDLIHKLAPTYIAEETQANGVTFFKYAPPTAPGASPQAPATETLIALTPQYLLIGSDKKAIHDLAERAGASQGSLNGSSFTDNPEFQRIRAMFPAELLGLSVTDYTHSNTLKVMLDAISPTAEKDKTKTSPEQLQLIQAFQNAAWLKLISQLRWSVSAWWKDADGIHFENRVR